MNNLRQIMVLLAAIPVVFSCEQGIDPITAVDSGADASAPTVAINAPVEGAKIKVLEVVTSVTIDFEVTDDIEVASIDVMIDGSMLQSYSNFKDYRRVLVDDLVYDKLTDGAHELVVRATDIEGKTTSETVNFEKEPAYVPIYAGEVLYMPFDGDYFDLVNIRPAEKVGDPSFAGDGFVGLDAYAGAADAHLTLPTNGLTTEEFSATMWYKLNSDPDRAGILVMGPPDTERPEFPDVQNLRTNGFRFFREAGGDGQVFKLNVGNGTADSWFDGGATASIPSDTADWVHLAFTISNSECVVYIDGEVVAQGAFTGVDWTGCDILSIASGVPRFTEWNHRSDLSYIDELRLFDKALTQEEVQSVMNLDL